MYEDIDGEHKKIRTRLTNATLKCALGFPDGYKPDEGYQYLDSYYKRRSLVCGIATFGYRLQDAIWNAGIDAYYDEDRVLPSVPYKGDSTTVDLSHPHVRVIIPRFGEVLVVFARVHCPDYYVMWYVKRTSLPDGVAPYMGDYLTTEALIDNLKALMQYAKGYAQCGNCYYSGDHSNYCGMGEVMHTGTCTKGRPIL